MATSLVQDPFIQSTVSQVQVRAEDQQNTGQLVDTFVDPGVTIQLENDNSQILYGRRGTGKTHVLQVVHKGLESQKESGRLSVYVDMRTLGSSSIFQDEQQPLHIRVSGLLKDVLEQIHARLLNHITDPETIVTESALNALDDLGKAMTRTVLVKETLSREATETRSIDGAGEIGVSISATPELSARVSQADNSQHGLRLSRSGSPQPTLYFSEIGRSLDEVLEASHIAHLTILLDEWNSVPYDLQPLLAEFIRRGLIAHPRVSVKIGSIEYRSNFHSTTAQGSVVGFELGADVSAVLDLDDYYVLERNRSQTIGLFAQLLFSHLHAEADRQSGAPDYLRRTLDVGSPKALADRLFSGPKVFQELVRAGEGVPRDFINIFGSAFFKAVRGNRREIDAGHVRQAASEWYEMDKASNIGETEDELMSLVVQRVIGKAGMSMFLMSKGADRSSFLRSLVDLRLVHLVRRGFRPNRDRPGERFSVYSLDYGTYADLMGSNKAPRVMAPEAAARDPKVVVLDDFFKAVDTSGSIPDLEGARD